MENMLEDIFERYKNVSPSGERITRILREAILCGYLEPGSKITEEKIADLFKVSRTPVREAIMRLEDEKLIENIPRAGMQVRQFSIQDFIDLYSVLECLQALSGKLAAQSNISLSVKMKLTQLAEKIREEYSAGNFAKGERYSYDFHVMIAECSGNPFLKEAIESMLSKVRIMYPEKFIAKIMSKDVSYRDHIKLIEYITTGNAEAAEKLSNEHVSKLRTMLIERQSYAD